MNNPLAFPSGDMEGWQPHQGMTLRDYFAARALPAIIAIDIAEARFEEKPLRLSTYAELASFAYELADAMMIEKESRDKRVGR